MKLKVAWRKVLKRTRILLGNLFRLRYLWRHLHGDTPLKYLSVDQKPSWFNNAAHTGTYARVGRSAPVVLERHDLARQRYTILTSVPSCNGTLGRPGGDHGAAPPAGDGMLAAPDPDAMLAAPAPAAMLPAPDHALAVPNPDADVAAHGPVDAEATKYIPPLCVLFKGKPNGRIKAGIEAEYKAPAWMRLQIQEHGSYKSSDVEEALEWMLPNARNSRERV